MFLRRTLPLLLAMISLIAAATVAPASAVAAGNDPCVLFMDTKPDSSMKVLVFSKKPVKSVEVEEFAKGETTSTTFLTVGVRDHGDGTHSGISNFASGGDALGNRYRIKALIHTDGSRTEPVPGATDATWTGKNSEPCDLIKDAQGAPAAKKDTTDAGDEKGESKEKADVDKTADSGGEDDVDVDSNVKTFGLILGALVAIGLATAYVRNRGDDNPGPDAEPSTSESDDSAANSFDYDGVNAPPSDLKLAEMGEDREFGHGSEDAPEEGAEASADTEGSAADALNEGLKQMQQPLEDGASGTESAGTDGAADDISTDAGTGDDEPM